jgi:hypothetical protein
MTRIMRMCLRKLVRAKIRTTNTSHTSRQNLVCGDGFPGDG